MRLGFSGARALILKHRHEQENGRTSAVTVEIMGYKVTFILDTYIEFCRNTLGCNTFHYSKTPMTFTHIALYKQGDEQVIAVSRNHAQRWNEVMEKSDHSVTLIDLCGE